MGDAERGKRLFMKVCATCHSYKKDEPHKFGPNLIGIFDKQAGTASDFKYNEANKNVDMIWNEGNLRNFLENPMDSKLQHPQAFDPLEKEKDKTDLIAFLKSLKCT